MIDNPVNFKSGDRVRLVERPPYLKTAEPMPMLRPPDLVAVGESGVVLSREPGEVWSVRFEKGAYLLAGRYLELMDANAG